MSIPVFTVDLDAKCAECGKGGAMPSGICLACANKALAGKPMRSTSGRAVAARFERLKQFQAAFARR